MYVSSLSINMHNYTKPTSRVAFRAYPIVDTFEKSANKIISPNELKTIVVKYLDNKIILDNLSDYKKLSGIKEKLLKTIKYDRRTYFFGNNPECDIDNFEEYLAGFKDITFDEKINLMTDIANKNNGKHLNFWHSHPEILLAYINSNQFAPYQINNFSDKTWDIMITSLEKVFNSSNAEKNILAILRYSNNNAYRAINTMLRLKPIFKNYKKESSELSHKTLTQYYENIYNILNNEMSIISDNNKEEEFIKDSIKNILKYLKNDDNDIQVSTTFLTKILDSSIKKIEQFWNDKNFEDTVETLKKLMFKVNDCGDEVHLLRTCQLKELDGLKINGIELHKNLTKDDLTPDIINKINKNMSTVTQKSFLSTSIYPHIYMDQPVNFSLTLDNNVECLYLSDIISIINNCHTEAELLVHPNSLIKISSAEKKKDKLYIKGTAFNNYDHK